MFAPTLRGILTYQMGTLIQSDISMIPGGKNTKPNSTDFIRALPAVDEQR